MNYWEEQNLILKDILYPIEQFWKKDLEKQEKYNENFKHFSRHHYDLESFGLELFITNKCNQKCEYCYLQKQEDLYPEDINNEEEILNNLRILLEYYLEEKFNFNRIDLFSGEIWGWDLGNKIFDILLEYINKGLVIKRIIIPTNGSFCSSEKILNKIIKYICLFNEKDTSLIFSLSYDGPIVDDMNRPLINNKEKKELYKENLFKFSKQFNYGFHPMISASTIEYQKDNYEQWLKCFKKYHNNEKAYYGKIMQLEVRSNEWTDEKIIYYLDWLNFIINTDLKYYFNNDLEEFKNFIFLKNKKKSFPYVPYFINKNSGRLGCTLDNSLSIRLGDLAIIPCHRTGYKKMVLGNYKVENNKIIGIEAKNIYLANSIYNIGFLNKPKCANCLNNIFCIKYCIGQNYESEKELFYPTEENCNLQKAKNIFLMEKYLSLGILDDEIKKDYDNIFIMMEREGEKWKILSEKIISQS